MATGTQLERSPAASGGALEERVAGLWGRAQLQWAAMTPLQRLWAGVAGGLLVAMVGGLIWYAARTDWKTLYADLDPEDARQTSLILTQAQIPNEPTADGAGIRVPAAQLDKIKN